MLKEERMSRKKSFLVTVAIIIALIGVICMLGGCGDSESPSEDVDATKSEKSIDYIESGMYKVGDDLDPGTYLIFGEGYMQLSKDSSGDMDSIITNDNFVNTRYVNVKKGEYLEFSDGKAYRLKDAPEIENDGKELLEGMYKIGRDIDPGEYKVVSLTDDEYSGYYEVSKDSRGNLDGIITNDNFSGTKYLTIGDGQYLKLSGCKLLLK